MKNILKSVVSLSALQLLHYFIPVIILPYVVRMLGPEKYGVINVAQSLVWYFVLFINYGFELYATKEVAVLANDPLKLSAFFSKVFNAKMWLMVLSGLVYFAVIFLSGNFSGELGLYAINFLLAIGYAILPNWFFLGIQKYQRILALYVAVRLISLIGVFTLVKSAADYKMYVFLLAAAQFFVGVFSLWIALRHYSVKLGFTPVRRILGLLKDAFPVFVSTLVTGLMSSTYIFVLGMITIQREVGYFSAALRLLMAIIGVLLIPVSQIFFPKIAQQFAVSRERGIKTLQLSILSFTAIGLGVAVVIFFGAGLFVKYLFGPQFTEAVLLLKILSFVPLINGLSNTIGTHGMLNLKMDKVYMRINIAIIFIGVCILIPMSIQMKGIGAAITWTLVEAINLMLLVFFIRRKNASVFKFGGIVKYFKGVNQI